MSDAPKRARLPRPVKAFAWLAAAVGAYTVAGFFVLPAVIKSQMLKRLPDITHRQAAVREVKVNPYTLALTVNGLSLTESNGAPFTGFDQLHFQFQALSSISARAFVFKDVTVSNCFAQITRRKDGSFNFENVVLSQPARAKVVSTYRALPPLLVETLAIEGAAITLDDLVPASAFHGKLGPLRVRVTQFSTRPNASASYIFSAVSDAGENISAVGQFGVQPPGSVGRVHVAGLDLKRYATYLADFTSAEIVGGKLDATAEYRVAASAKGLEADAANASAQLTGFQVKAPDSGEIVLSIPKLTVERAEASLAKKSVRVRSIKSSGGSAVVRRNQDGTINLLALIKKQPVPAKPGVTNVAPWTAQVDEIAFDTFAAQIEDLKPAQPVKMDVRDLGLSVGGFKSTLTAPMFINSMMRLNGQGTLSVNGTIALEPLSADLVVALTGLDLPLFQPYLAGMVKVQVTSGQLEVVGKAHYAAGPAAPMATFAGDVSVTNLATTDQINGMDLVKFESLGVKGIDFAFQPNQLHVQVIHLVGLDGTVLVETNRRINLLDLLPPPSPGPAASSSNSLGAFPVTLDALALDRASIHVLDHSIRPACALDVREVSGTVQKISTQDQGPSAVKLDGRIGSFSTFSVAGNADPLSKDLSLDLIVSCKNFDLTTFTSYVEKYGGHSLKKGKLLMDLHYGIAGRELNATNKIVVSDLTLGPKNHSPDATHLPVQLGVAMMKNRNGEIILDIPVSGSLDDPKFQVASIVWQTIMGDLVKVATSPFSLLGAIAGGGGEELSYVDFPPGSAVLTPAEQAKIRNLSAALYERPALNLEIAASTDPSSDAAALARLQLGRRLQELRARELATAHQAVLAVDTTNIPAADYWRLIEVLYAKSFGANAPAPVPPPVTPIAAVDAGPPPPLTTTPIFVRQNFQKGGQLLMEHISFASEVSENPAPPTTAPPPATAPPASPGQTPAAPPAPEPAELARMEERLIADIHVSDDDLRELMQARARAVQADVLESGKVAAARVAIVAPEAIHRSARGETRVNFSLQ